jgi:hypothetical protein
MRLARRFRGQRSLRPEAADSWWRTQPPQDRLLIESARDGNRDGNRGELWRTLANVGERWRTKGQRVMYRANVGERLRMLVNYARPVLKTTKVQAFGGSNPSPSAKFGFTTTKVART